MAKGTNIGSLNFRMDADNKAFLAKIAEAEKDVLRLQTIMQSIGKGSGIGNTSLLQMVKAQNVLNESTEKQRALQEKTAQQVVRTEREKQSAQSTTNAAAERQLALQQKTAQQIIRTEREKQISQSTTNAAAEKQLALQQKTAQQVVRTEREKQSAQSLSRADAERQLALQQKTARETMKTEQLRQRMLAQSSLSQNNLNNLIRNQEGILKSLTKKAVGLFSVYQVSNLVKEIVSVRGEIQQLEFAFETMLGSKAASEAMMKDIVNLSLETPYTLTEMAGNVKQLIAMGIEADKVVQTMKNLGDVAAGVSVPIWRIAINYGQVAALGKLQGREVRDFAMAGVPIVQQLAEQMGKTTAEIQNMVSAGKIGFPDVEEAFRRMSSEGGKFNNMMQKQNSSVLGQIGKLKEQVQLMLNGIGESSEGVIYGVLNVGSELVHNYETIGKTLLGLVATYGVYKAALVSISILEKQQFIYKKLIVEFIPLETALRKGATVAMIQEAAATRALNTMKGNLINTTKALLKSIVPNPYILATAAVIGLGYAIYKLATETTRAEENLKKTNESFANAESSAMGERKELARLSAELGSLTEGTDEYKKVKNEIVSRFGKYYNGLGQEISQVGLLASTYKQLTTAIRESALARAKDEELQRVSGDYKDDMSKALDQIKKNIESSSGSLEVKAILYKKIYDEISKGNEGIIDTRAINRLNYLKTKDVSRYNAEYDSLSAINKVLYKNEELYKAVVVAKRANEDYDVAQKIVNDKFPNDFRQQQQAVEAKDMESYEEQYKKALKEYVQAKKNVESIKSNKSIYSTEAYDDAIKKLSEAEEIFKQLGGETKEKSNGSSKITNSRLDSLKQEIEVVKQAQTEYEKLKGIMSSEDAFNKIKEQTPFKNITKDLLTDDGLLSLIDSQLNSLSKQKSTKENNDYVTSLFTLSNDTLSKIAKANIGKVENELKKYKSEYSIYESLFSVTGDKDQSAYLAFGNIDEQLKSYKEKLKEAIDTASDPELKQKLTEELTSLDFADKSEFSKRMAQLVKEYQSVEEQIRAIRAKGENDALEIKRNADNATQELMNARLKANEDFVNKQISDLTNGAMQASDSYQRLFSSMNDISSRELQSLINQWKNAIDKAKQGNDGRFTISIQGENFSVTEKELSSLTKRILKSEKELRERNPFKALKDSLKELGDRKTEINDIKKKITELEKIKSDAMNEKASGNGSSALDILIDSSSVKVTELKDHLSQLGGEGATSLQKVGVAMQAVGQQVVDVLNSLSAMFDALGKEDTADTLSFIGEMTSSLSNIGKSIAAGDPVGAVTGVINGITSVFRQHDKKLEKRIKKSQLEVKKLQGSYSDLARFIERQLGAVTEKQAQEQIDNLKAQQAELEKQMALESKKKKSDKSAIEDYKNSISELEDQIKYFYEELLDEEYGLNLKSIASQISDSLVDAFKSGEDAAKAFDSTVSDIINDLAAKMITMQVLEPAMDEIRDYLFGNNGVFNDGELSVSDAQGLVGKMTNLKDSIGKSKEIWDALNEAAKQAGLDLADSSTKDTLSKGIESITEDTANLLASYLNAIRADVSVNREFLSQLVQLSQLNSNTFAAQLAELMKIQANTLATANNTSRLVELSESTYTLLQKATISGSGTKINI